MLVEREEEVTRLAAVLTESGQSRGSVAVIRGPAASGKTELIHALGETAQRTGFLVLEALASPEQQRYPYGVFVQLLEHVDDEVSRELGDCASDQLAELGAAPAPRAAQLAPRLLHGVHRALTRLASQRPVLIAVDDVQSADLPSLHCLLYLVRRCRSAPMAIALTHGSQRCAVYPSFLAELLYQSQVQTIRLSMLSRDGVRQMIAEDLGDAAGRLAADYGTASGGNPALVRALLQDRAALGEGAARGHDRPVARRMYRQAAVACVHRCGPEALRVARAIAILAGFDSAYVVGELAELEEQLTRQAVQTLISSGLFIGRTFRHPAIRAGILDDLPMEERTRLRHRAARLLYNMGAPPVAIAAQLVVAEPLAEQWVVSVLRDAATESVENDRIRAALRYLKLADRCCADPQQRSEINFWIAWLIWRLNPDTARHYLTAAVTEPPHLPGRLVVKLISSLVWHDLAGRAVMLAEGAAGSWDHDDPELDVHVRSLKLWLETSFPAIAPRLGHLLPSGPAPAGTLEAAEPLELTAFRALSDVLNTGKEEPVALAERILQGVQRIKEKDLIPVMASLFALLYAERFSTAGAWCDRFLADVAERQAPAWEGLLRMVRAQVWLRQGKLAAAITEAEAALERLPAEGLGSFVGLPMATLIEGNVAAGEPAVAADLVRRRTPAGLFQTRFGLHYLYARGKYHAAIGSHRAALSDFLTCGDRMQAWNMDSPALVPWRAAAAEAYLALGERERAVRLIEEEIGRSWDGRPRARAAALRVAAAVEDAQSRVQTLRRAVGMLAAVGDRYGLAQAHADLARALREVNQEQPARVHMQHAVIVVRECGVDRLRRALLAEGAGTSPPAGNSAGNGAHARAGSGAPSATGAKAECGAAGSGGALGLLSTAERRVAVLAARGDTNREISQKLFITVSTVEQHLTRIYRKLEATRRQDLARALGHDGTAREWPARTPYQ